MYQLFPSLKLSWYNQILIQPPAFGHLFTYFAYNYLLQNYLSYSIIFIPPFPKLNIWEYVFKWNIWRLPTNCWMPKSLTDWTSGSPCFSHIWHYWSCVIVHSEKQMAVNTWLVTSSLAYVGFSLWWKIRTMMKFPRILFKYNNVIVSNHLMTSSSHQIGHFGRPSLPPDRMTSW